MQLVSPCWPRTQIVSTPGSDSALSTASLPQRLELAILFFAQLRTIFLGGLSFLAEGYALSSLIPGSQLQAPTFMIEHFLVAVTFPGMIMTAYSSNIIWLSGLFRAGLESFGNFETIIRFFVGFSKSGLRHLAGPASFSASTLP